MSYIDIVILRHLAPRPVHGYELRKRVEATTGFTLHNNALYPALRRFEEAGAVVKTTETQPGRPARLVYELTDVGRQLLHDLLAELPPDQAGDEIEFLSRLGQFDLLDPDERAAIIDSRDAAVVGQIEHFRSVIGRAHGDTWGITVLQELTRRAEHERTWLASLRTAD